MRAGGGGRTIVRVRPHQSIPSWLILSLAWLLPGCASAPQKVAPERHDAAALTVVAEIALKRGDCKGASEAYAKAASVGAASLARRASEVALTCEHLPAAWQSVSRWRSLTPDDREAMATYAAVALKLYRLPEARVAIGEFSHSSSPIHGPTDPAEYGLPELAGLLLEHSDAAAVLTAMAGALEPENPSPDTLALLGELALSAYDAKRAQHYAELALQRDPKSFAALRVLARAYVMHGDAPHAIETARAAMHVDAARGAFELAEILTELDRDVGKEQERGVVALTGGGELREPLFGLIEVP